MNFVFFSTALWDWSDGAQPGPQFARELARRGHRLLFVQPRRPGVSSGSPLIQIVGLSDLGLADHLVDRAWHGIRIDSLEEVAQNLSRRVSESQSGECERVAIWFAPFEPFARLLPILRAHSYQILYYPQDDFSNAGLFGHYRNSVDAECYLIIQADGIIALSRPVAEKMKGSGKRVEIIPDGINLSEFRSAGSAIGAPESILRGQRTLGFWGFLSQSMVNASALEFVARERPNWAINLIGACDEKSAGIMRLTDLPNIRFHGQVKHSRLKDYGAAFDVCLLPAPDNEFSRGRDPLKVYEYLALYKPVVCMNMPQLEGMPYVRNSSGSRQFLECIEKAISTQVDRDVVDGFLREQTWTARADELLKLISRVPQSSPSNCLLGSGVDQPKSSTLPSFLPKNPAIDAYLDSLEKDLDETRTWARSIEAQIREQQSDLDRFYGLMPVRIARAVRRTLATALGR